MKYSQQRISDMATKTIMAGIFMPSKYKELISEVARRTGLATKVVEQKIRALSNI